MMNDTTFSRNGKVSFIPVITNTTTQPQTNADRIRQMSDEELCVFLAGIYTLDTDAYGDYDPCVVIDDHKFREPNGLLDWLKSPVEVQK